VLASDFELFLWKKGKENEVFELKNRKNKAANPSKKIKIVVVFASS
jgi:hypothetical protein